jgi:ParB family chromosome partitioning protein
LGRGLSALLGESFAADLGKPQPAAAAPAPQPAAPRPEGQGITPPPYLQPVPAPAPEQRFEETKSTEEVLSRPEPVSPVFATAEPAAPAAPIAPAPGSSAHGETVSASDVKLIPIELITPNPNQPRRSFSDAELNELADSIKVHGVLQPILVRPAISNPGRYEIVAGERRWRAAQRASVHALPAVVRELDEVEVLEIGIIENVQRADLNPLEEAQGYQTLINQFGRTQQDIADVVGKSRPYIANLLRLLNLPAEIQEMVRDGRLAAGAARAVLTAPDPVALAREAVIKGLNVRDIEKLAGAAKDAKSGGAAKAGGSDADTRALEAALSAALGLTVTISGRGETGEVRIAYKKLEQLDEIARRLNPNA